MDALMRRAHPSEAKALTAMMRRSKAHWGYDAATKARQIPLLSLTSAQIARNDVFVIVDQGAILGLLHQWYHYHEDESLYEAHLEDLFIEPAAIGQGLGRRLFEYALELARARGCTLLTLEADPHAEDFYLRMGAQRVGLRASTVGDYSLPQMSLML